MGVSKQRLNKRQRLARLSEQLDRLTPDYEDECGAEPNEAETAFARMALMRGKKPLRNGWPDFLLYDELIGGTIAVEVKQGRDPVRPAQARMFAALERAGVTVMVWDPSRPLALQPWRRYCDDRVEALTAEKGPRQPQLGRMRSANGRHR